MSRKLLSALAVMIALVLPVAGTHASPGATEWVSVDGSGNRGNASSISPSISADGRYIAFSSLASNLAPGDTNSLYDVFVHDTETGQTTLVSVPGPGAEAYGGSYRPSISADGRYVAFTFCSGLSGGSETIVQDLSTGQRTRLGWDACCGYPSISADARYVAFYSAASTWVPGDTNGVGDIFVYDTQAGQTQRVSVDSMGNQGNDSSGQYASISADGRYVAFSSGASNLVPGDTNGTWDIFVHDRQTRRTERLSVDSAGSESNNHSDSPSISADGRYVAFWSIASNLVPGDTNGTWDIFVHDRRTGRTERVSVDSAGNQGNDSSSPGSISADGRYVAFSSYASNLVPGDTANSLDVFVHDRQSGQTTRVSVDNTGNEAYGIYNAVGGSISADGRYVAFVAETEGNPAGLTDVFVHDRCPDGSCVQPPRQAVLFIKGINTSATCNEIDSGGWKSIRDSLEDSLGMAPIDFLEYDYTSADATAQGCGLDGQFAQFTEADTCWSLNDTSVVSPLTGQGQRLASFLDDYLTANPSVRLSIVGWSQGGVLALYTLRRFAAEYSSLGRVDSVVTLDSPLKGITSFSAGFFRAWMTECGGLDRRYDSTFDMQPSADLVQLVKSGNATHWPTTFTVNETGQDGTCPACIDVVDSNHSTVDWAADRLSVFTGNHGTVWNGAGDPIGQRMLQRFIACAIGGLRPAATCHDYADLFADTPLNIDLGETVSQPYLLQDNNQLFSIRLDKGDLDLQSPQPQYALAAAETTTATVTMRLISPSDRIIDASTSDADVTHSVGDRFEQFDLGDPEAGDWTVELYGADVPPEGADVYLSFAAVPDASVDQDDDGVRDSGDNCPDVWNATQSDADQDGIGDVCDADDDNDGVPDTSDNCEFAPNPDQADYNTDGVGDACDPDLRDLDSDSVLDGVDNCPFVPNADQVDSNGNGIGDACESSPAVGGIAELPDIAGTSAEHARAPAGGSNWSAGNYAVLGAGLATAGLAVAAGAWYARRRWLR